MSRSQFILGITLYGIGAALLGYGIGCMKTRGEFMEAIARSCVNVYAEKEKSSQEKQSI